MQKIFTNIKFNSRTIISIVVILCIFAVGFAVTAALPQVNSDEPIVAEAATTITASNYRTAIQNNGSTGTISGEYVLDSNIAISAGNGVNLATFNGTFDGKGHTITVNGSLNYTAGRNNDYYVGMIFGRLGSGAVVKNLNIVWNAYWNVLSYNNKTSASYSGEGSTTVFVGGLCGLASNGATIQDVSFTLGSTIAGIGIDDGTNHETQTGGQGAVVGAMIGRSQGAKMKNITFTNNGSVYARGNSLSGGSSHKGVTVSLAQPDTRGDRAVAGGMIGEIQSGSTQINGLVFKGDGYVGAAATGATSCVSNSSNTNHTINFAGGIIGFTYGGTLVIDGMLYEYQGKCYVKEAVTLGKNAGTILGKGSGVTINSLWRRTDDVSIYSGTGVWSYYSGSSGPSKSGASAMSVEKTIGNNSVTTVAQGAASAQTNAYRTKEYKPTAYYSGSSVSFGSGTIKDIKNGYLTIAGVSNDTSYYISALTYNMTNNGAFTTKNYYNVALVNSATFLADDYQIPVNCNEFRLVLAKTEKNMYVSCTGDKTYDTLGIPFTGAASESNISLLSNLYWVAEHDSDSLNNVQGSLGSAQITTGSNVGTYTMVLYRYDAKTGTSARVQDGESLGANTNDAPSTIYQFDATVAQTYRYTISRAEVDLIQLSAAYVREYDGTSKVDGNDLTYKLHYGFKLSGTETEPKDTPVFKVGSGDFYDSTGTETDGSVGSNKVVKITGIEVTGNYKLSASSGTTLTLNNCRITERSITYEWGNLTQVYDGTLIKPTIVATNLVEGDSVFFTINVYKTVLDAANGNAVIDKTDVRLTANGEYDYYIVRATIASNPNYTIPGGYAEDHLYVTKKQIGLTWSVFEKTFEYADQNVTCVVTNAASAVASGDDVGLQISYYHNETASVAALRNAGTYIATATITNTNYVLDQQTATFSNIKINPIALDIVFYTGGNYSSNTVQDLIYQGTTYIGDANGLHAKMAPSAQGKGLIDANIEISYNGNLINVGTYVATASFIDSDENTNEDIIITNYSITQPSQNVNIIARDITLNYGTDTFEYDGLSHTVDASVDEGRCGQDVITIRSEVTKLENSVYVSTIAINAGSYTVQYSLNNSNYKIKTGYAQHNLTINQYDIEQVNSKFVINPINAQNYTGLAITPAVVVKFDGTIMQSENYTVDYTANISAGQANVTVSGQKNFKGNISTTFIINKALLTVSFDQTQSTLQYNGKEQKINATFEGIKQPDKDNNLQIGMLIDYGGKTVKDKGNYTATVSFDGDPANYTLSENLSDRQFNFEITAKPVEIEFLGYSNLIFNGYSYAYDAVKNPEGSIKVVFSANSGACENDDLSLAIAFDNVSTASITDDPCNAGTYNATATLSGNSKNNYYINSINIQKFVISPYQIGIVYDLSTVSHTYSSETKQASYTIDESTPLISVDGSIVDPDIELRYKDLNSDKYVNGYPINAGNYQIEARIKNTNYSSISNEKQNFVINKAPLEVNFNLQNNGIYTYDAQKRTISYRFVAPNSLLGGNTFNLVTKYYKEDGTQTSECINCGTYKVIVELPTDVSVARNYYICNANDSYGAGFSTTFTIVPRYISIRFDKDSSANTYYYDGNNMVVTATVGQQDGKINDLGYESNSGLVYDSNQVAQAVTFVVKIYAGTEINDQNLVDNLINVGTYTATAVLDPSNHINDNYVIYEDNQEDYPTTSTIVINPKKIVFKSSYTKFTKEYGATDPNFRITLNAENTNNGISSNDSITVQMERGLNTSENVGDYPYTGFKIVELINGSWVQIDPENYSSNYEISYYGMDGLDDRFTITVREEIIIPKTFTFDYKTDITGLTQQIIINSSVLSIEERTINVTFEPELATITNGIDAGDYNLSSQIASQDNPNVKCIIAEGTNENKIKVVGRSVEVKLDNSGYVMNNGPFDPNFTYYITYMDKDPDLYEGLYVQLEKCDESINEGNFKSYVDIKLEEKTNANVEYRQYKESGYLITINFLKKTSSGQFITDKNYRPVDAEGNDITTAYRLFVNKYDLNKDFAVTNNINRPSVLTTKNYDGTNKASIQINPADNKPMLNIPSKFADEHTLTVYAAYEDKNVGTNKTINLYYAFTIESYGINFILPGEIVGDEGVIKYTDDASINPVTLNLSFGLGDYELTYGERYSKNPTADGELAYPNILYSGFVNNETPEYIGLDVSLMFKEGTNYVSLESYMNAGSHTIAIVNNKSEYTNYIVNASAEQNVIIAPKLITITAGETFVKTVDGNNRVELTSANYVINGLIDRDANTTNALAIDYNAIINSTEPGKTTITMTIMGLRGTQSSNYKLPEDKESNTIEIPAEIKELAVVKFDSESYSYDFDNTSKTVAPTIEEGSVQENVKFLLKYEGKRYDGKDYLLQTSAPKSAGVYTIHCYFYHESDALDTSKHRLLASTEMIINKITPTMYFSGNYNQTYGSFTAISASVKAPGLEKALEVRYSFENEDGTLPSFPPAGRHTVYASFEETNDYLDVEGEQVFQIKAKTISVSFDGYKNLTYNGYSRNDDVKVFFSGIVPGDTCEPVKIFNVDNVKDAGTYRLIVKPSNNSYTISGSHSVEFTIAKKALKVSVPSGITTYAGIAPKINLIYEGFVENEGVEDIQTLPTPKLTSGKVGVNVIEFNEGYDENYSFTYVNGVYTIEYESPNKDKPNLTPYVVTGCAVGGIALIFVIGYLVKIGNYKAITSGVAKRKIRKEMINKTIKKK